MFDELKEVKSLKDIKPLKSLQKEEVYLETNQASMIKLFCKYT